MFRNAGPQVSCAPPRPLGRRAGLGASAKAAARAVNILEAPSSEGRDLGRGSCPSCRPVTCPRPAGAVCSERLGAERAGAEDALG